MRPRLTLSFVVLTLILLLGALGIRAYTAHDLLRTHESRELRSDASMLALLIEQREELGEPVDRAYLAGLVDSAEQISYDAGDGEPIVVEGKAFESGPDDLTTTVDAATTGP